MKDKSFERREQLLSAALDEFSRKSYEEASLNNIIKAAGISKGTFYYHFENKERLYLHLLDRVAKAKWAFINQNMQADRQQTADIFGLLAEQAQLGLQFAHAEPRYHMLYIMFLKEKDNPIYQKARLLLEGGNEHMLEDMISRAYDAGAFKKTYSREFAVRVMCRMFSSFYDIFPETEDLAAASKNLPEFIQFLKTGLAK